MYWIVLKRHYITQSRYISSSRSLSSDSSGELDILWHDGDSLGVDGSKVGVFEKSNNVGLSSFLEGKDSWWLESQVSLEIISNFSNKSLEWELSNEEFSWFLESSDFSKWDGSWSESVGSLDSTWGSESFTLWGFGSYSLSWLFGSSCFSCSVFGSCHFDLFYFIII